MLDRPTLHQDSPGWIFFVHAAFAISLLLMCIGIYHLPTDLWIRGYLVMGLFFTVASSLTLSKTLRDNHEAKKVYNTVREAKTEQVLADFSMRSTP